LSVDQIPFHAHTIPGGDTVNAGGSQSHTNMQPFQALNYIIALQGIYPSQSLTADSTAASLNGGSNPYLGEVALFAGNYSPAGWALAHGQLLALSGNDALFSLIGTIYGGDGQTTFGLPDLRGRVPVHVGNGFNLGGKAGVEYPALLESEMPAHTHTFDPIVVVPEPSTLVLLLTGGIGLLGYRIRRKRKLSQ